MKSYKLYVRTDMEAQRVSEQIKSLGYMGGFGREDTLYPFFLMSEGGVSQQRYLDKNFFAAPHEFITVEDFLALKPKMEFPFKEGVLVLARDTIRDDWVGVRYKLYNEASEYPFTSNFGSYKMIAPLNADTLNLIGTNVYAHDTWTDEDVNGMDL